MISKSAIRKNKSVTQVASQQRAIKRRLTMATLGFIAIALSIGGRAVFVQILGDPRLEKLTQRQFRSRILVRPHRGLILDRNGEALAINTETKSLAANPVAIANSRDPAQFNKLIQELARVTRVSPKKLQKRLKSKKNFVWIKRHLQPIQMAKLMKSRSLSDAGELTEGFWLVQEDRRYYPHGDLASHVVGSVNVDLEGIEGLELKFNQQLRGHVVSVSAIKDAFGRPTFIDAVAARDVQNGTNLQLTLDMSLQFEVEKHLKNSIAEQKALAGTVIVMNAVNGEILALANQPSFSPNQRWSKTSHRRNRALTDGYEPGSTIKPLLMLSALSNQWKPDQLVWGGLGRFKVGNRFITEAETHEKWGWLDYKKILKVSSNIGAAKIALDIGAENFLTSLKRLGFGQKTGSQFPGEISGWMPKVDSIRPIRLANMGFGQGILVTPLQMIRAWAVLANGGWLVTPKLVLGQKTEEPLRVFSSDLTEKVSEALEAVVQKDATGEKAAVPGFVLAGKTGTAQMIDPKTKSYSKKDYHASFIGFARGLESRIVIFASLDRPRKNYYASQTAAPLFKKIFESVAHRYSFPVADPEHRLALNEAVGENKPHTFTQDQIKISQSAPVPVKWEQAQTSKPEKPVWIVPDFTGLTPREVLHHLQGQSFSIQINGQGLVSRQWPKPGSEILPGSKINITLHYPGVQK